MLWDLVFDFFTRYLFGGMTTNGDFYYTWAGSESELSVTDFTFTFFGVSYDLPAYLSLISTIITMVVILVLCCALIKKIYNMCAHIIG